jgi:hypothetical protein
MKLFAILFTLILSADANKSLRKMVSANDCKSATITAAGSAPNTEALSVGQIITWAWPIYVDGTTEIGEWEGYCVGLGTEADSAGGQICTHLYVLEENGGLFQVEEDEGFITGTSVYDAGDAGSVVVITGGSGSYQDASGAVSVTFANGSYNHTFNICF